MRLVIAFLLTLALSSPALAQYWTHYDNARFGYGIDVPPGFEGQGESDNGDGQVFYLPNGMQELTVWGGWLGVSADTLEGEAAGRSGSDMGAGWAISYSAATPQWATWSGTQGDSILYQRMILLCDGESYAAFRLTYPARDLAPMHSVLEGLVRSFVPSGC